MPRVGAFFIVEASDATGVCGASSDAPQAPPRPKRKAGLSASTASGSAGVSEAPSAAPREPLAARPPRPAAPRPPRPSSGGDGWFFIVQAATNSSRCVSVDQPFKLILIGSPAPLIFAVVAVKCRGAGACALIVARANPSRASICDGRILRISISLLENLYFFCLSASLPSPPVTPSTW